MDKFYGSFGQTHTHRHNEVTLDKDILVEINAIDILEARQKMFEYFGPTWFTVYTEAKVDMSYFPRGTTPLEGRIT